MMTSKSEVMANRLEKKGVDVLHLKGLSAAPGQVWGGIRLVPLIRDTVREDLRMQRVDYGRSYKSVTVKGHKDKPKESYTSYIPHGLIVSHGEQAGEAHVAWRTALGSRNASSKPDKNFRKANRLHRMVKRIDRHSVRMLPMHMAIEGFLALHFGGPDIAYEYYSKRSLRFGLTPRVEYGISGWAIPDLGNALSRFEMHPGQCGMLIYVADALASAFVVAHPDDYRRLHTSVLEDMYAELFWYYGLQYRGVQRFTLQIEEEGVEDLASLRQAYTTARDELARFESEVMARDLIERDVHFEKLHGLGGFKLERFMTNFNDFTEEVNHIGERIVRPDGELAYLKTFRLSQDHVRKARLLDLLARNHWSLPDAAHDAGYGAWRLKQEIIQTGFGYILRHGMHTKC